MMHPLRHFCAALMAVTLLTSLWGASAEPLPQSPSSTGVETPVKPLPGLGGGDRQGADRSVAPRQQGLFGGIWTWMMVKQQALNREMAAAVKELKSAGSLASAGVLAFVAFIYGVLHAAGPGHGKAIISSYVLANERTVRRGIMLSCLAAFIQALSAIVIVSVLAVVLKATSMQMKSAEAWIETVSWGLVAAIGAWLLVRQARISFAAVPAHALGHRHSGHDAHHASHAHHHDHDHHHHDHGVACAECGHAHMPDPKQLEGDLPWGKALAIAFSVGIRPCTGAILVLVFALSQGLFWAGVFATFAMALGTAITVSVLAVMALGSRDFLARLGDRDGKWAKRVETAAAYGGAGLIFLLGTTFFIASLGGQSGF